MGIQVSSWLVAVTWLGEARRFVNNSSESCHPHTAFIAISHASAQLHQYLIMLLLGQGESESLD